MELDGGGEGGKRGREEKRNRKGLDREWEGKVGERGAWSEGKEGAGKVRYERKGNINIQQK